MVSKQKVLSVKYVLTCDILKVGKSERTMSFDEIPEKIRIKIWNYFDFETVQKTFTLVSQL